MRRRLIILFLILTFSVETLGGDAARAWSQSQAENAVMLPPGTLMSISPVFSLPTLRGIAIDPHDPFKINFVVDKADQNDQIQGQVNLLVKYFLSFLTIPEEDLWVNLSPYEKGRIITPDFENTNAGRDMLVEDYTLKQLASSLTYPGSDLGKIFWQKIFRRARQEYGSTAIPLNTFNKVWVVPDRAVVYEGNGSAFIAESHLKVLVEEDYLSMRKHGQIVPKNDGTENLSSQIMRELIVPELEREVNEGKSFAPLRQMFNSLILAIWFKKRLRENLIDKVYVDQDKTLGIALNEKQVKERIYAQYLKAFKKGVYNFIQEDYDAASHQDVPRKYFSGGFSFTNAASCISYRPASQIEELPENQRRFKGDFSMFSIVLNPLGVSKAALLKADAAQTSSSGRINKLLYSFVFAVGVAAGGWMMMPVSPTAPPAVPSVAAPAATNTALPAAAVPIQVTTADKDGQIEFHNFSDDVVPIPVEDQLLAEDGGVISGLDPDKKDYKAGDVMFSLIDPQVKGRIEQLTKELAIRQEKLQALQKLFPQQASGEEVTAAGQAVDEISAELAHARQALITRVAVAPHDLRVKNMLVANDMSVAKGGELLTYFDKQRIQVNIQVPPSLNYFYAIKGLKINGRPVESMVSLDWSLDPLQKNAQLSMIMDVPSSIVTGQPAKLEFTFSAPDTDHQLLETVSGLDQTLAKVNRVEAYVLRAPTDGPVQFLVHEGQQVAKGQIVAVVENKNYIEEYQNTRLGLRSLDIQIGLGRDIDGTLLIKRDELDRLKEQRAVFLEKLKTLEQEIQLDYVRAPNSGIVISRAAYQSKVFKGQDELLRIGTGETIVGNINGPRDLILFPKDLDIKVGDPVVVETPQGVRLPGKVTAVNKSPFDAARDLSANQAVEVMAFDRQNILQPNLPVNIILPQQGQRQQVLVAWDTVAHENTAAVPTPPVVVSPLGAPTVVLPAPAAATLTSTPDFTNGVPLLDLAGIDRLVAGNELVSGAQSLEVLQKKEAEAFPSASRFSLTGGVFMQNGKLVVSGGVQGMLKNSINGGLSSGNAIGSAVPLVFDLAGNIIDAISGKVVKETALAKKMTEIAYHHMQETIIQQSVAGQDLLIDIGAARQKIGELKKLQQDMRQARSVMKAREEAGFSLKIQQDQLDYEIQDITNQIETLETQQAEWKTQLDVLISRTRTVHFDMDISPVLPWGKGFTPIDAATKEAMAKQLLGPGSPNPRMQEVTAADQAVDMSIKLQNLGRLPFINLGGVFINNGHGLNPLYDVSEPVTGERTGNLQQGANPAGQIEIPLIDTVQHTKEAIVALEKQKSQLNIDTAKAELGRQLEQAVDDINRLSAQIQQTQEAYRNAVAVWEAKIRRPDFYLPYQLVSDRLEINKLWQELCNQKAQYLKAETSLRELRVWGQETSKVQAGPMDGLPAAVSAAVAGDFSVEAPSLIIPSLPSLNLMAFSQGEDTLAPGIINYHIGEDVSSAWALMHGNPSGADTPLDALKNILIKEPNTFVRADALKHFLAEYQGDSRFLPALKDIVERSAHPDVVWELLKYMSQREDRDPRFLVEVIDEGENSRDHLLVRLGFQALRDVLTMYPQEMKKLSPADFITSAHSPYPRATITAANKVFLTFLAQEPDDSIAAERLVQSDFWSTDDLKDIYKKLETAKDDHPGSAPQIEALAQFIQAADKRKAALDNIDQVFTPGPFGEHGGAVFQRDIISYIQIMDNARESQRFLNTSPQWEKMAAFIHPKLYACTLSEVQRPGPAAAAVPVDPVYDLMPSTAQHPELEYFQSLGLKEQEGYIEQSQDICELNRILDLNTPLRTVVLDRLMASSQGRVLVLKTYLGSDAPDLLGLIESRSWDTVLLADIPNIEDAASNRIVRSGLEKMYDRTGQEKYLNLRLLTYSDFELPALDDPRGKRIREAAIRRAAAIRALQAYQKHMEVEVLPWAGYSIQDARTKTEIANLQRIFVEEPDPVKVDEYIDSHTVLSRQVPRRIFDQINIFDGSVHSMFDYIRGARAKFVKRLAANDQSIPRLNIPQMASFLGLSAFLFLTSLYKRTYRFYRRNILHSDDQIKGLMYALKGDKLDKNLAVKWLKAHQENRLDRKGQIIGQDQGGQAADDFKTLSVNPPVQVYLPSREAFQTWYVLVSDWKTAPKVPPERLMADLNTILNNAKEVLRKMPYEPDLMYSGHAWESLDTDTYQKTYSYFMGLALETLNVMNVRLSGQKIGESQRRWMQAEAGIMNDMVKYVNRYLRVLTYRGNIERAISKKFSYQHWTERSKLAPLVRWILTDSYLWGQSQKRLFKELPLLLDEGNALMPDFYQDKDSIIEDTRIALNTATKRGGSLNNTQAREDRHNFRLGDFWGRVVYLSAFGLGFAGLAGIFIGYNMPFVELSTIAFFVVWVKVYLSYWRPHLDLLRMEWNKLAHKIRGDLKAQLDQKLGDFTEGPRKKQVVFFARKENQEQTAVELDTSHAPNVDMIVVVVSNAKSTANIENYVKGLRGQLIRNDIPVMVIPSRYQGSGNAYLSMLLRARDKFRSPAYKNKNRYPYLKSWDKSRKLFIFIGKEIDGMDVEYPLLDLSLQTGYRLAQKDPDMNGNAVEGGHITIYARDAYYGPTPYFPQQGITFLTARANRDELKERGFVNTNDRHDTLSPVSEILEKLDIAALENDKRSRKGRTLEYLEEKFNLQNHAIKQFDTLSGIVDVAPDAEEYLLKIAAYVDEHQLWKQWNRHLVGDLFVPTLMWMSNLDEEDKEEEVEQYIDKRSRWSDVNPNGNGHKQGHSHKNGNGHHEIQEKLRPFYSFIKGLHPQIEARAFLPYPLLTVSMHIAGKKFQEEMDRFKSIDHAQISQAPVLSETRIDSRPGGIDLSQTSDKILFQKSDAARAGGSFLVSQVLKSFKGFDFQVIEYRQISNPLSSLEGGL